MSNANVQYTGPFRNDLKKRETNQRSARRKRGTPQTVVTHARQLGVIYARRLGETTPRYSIR